MGRIFCESTWFRLSVEEEREVFVGDNTEKNIREEQTKINNLAK